MKSTHGRIMRPVVGGTDRDGPPVGQWKRSDGSLIGYADMNEHHLRAAIKKADGDQRAAMVAHAKERGIEL